MLRPKARFRRPLSLTTPEGVYWLAKPFLRRAREDFSIMPHGFSYCRVGGPLRGRPLIEPDLWVSHIRLSDDSCPHRARPCGLGFLCCGFKPPSKRGCGAFLDLAANRTLSNVTVHRKPVEVAALPFPGGLCCPIRYCGTMPASDSLFRLLVRDWRSSHCPACLVPPDQTGSHWVSTEPFEARHP